MHRLKPLVGVIHELPLLSSWRCLLIPTEDLADRPGPQRDREKRDLIRILSVGICPRKINVPKNTYFFPTLRLLGTAGFPSKTIPRSFAARWRTILYTASI